MSYRMLGVLIALIVIALGAYVFWPDSDADAPEATGLAIEPCSLMTADIVAEAFGTEEQATRTPSSDDGGAVCTYTYGEIDQPMMAVRALDLSSGTTTSQDLGKDQTEECGAVIRRNGPVTMVSGERWLVRMEAQLSDNPSATPPEPLVRAVAKAIADADEDRPPALTKASATC